MISSKQVIVNDLLSVLSLLVLASRKEGEEGEELLIPTIAVLARTRCGFVSLFSKCDFEKISGIIELGGLRQHQSDLI